ncbi:hypothetical protein MLD38_011760 [Melastoma candidum]|uniref:Uncharacterized protein n=1 Tax=Melastoma candidum TaxID=119954 RepID=A0ACB9R4N2_9MYRT|nr:hypothetical protein MLD38_011760 [Melastoma candidum]
MKGESDRNETTGSCMEAQYFCFPHFLCHSTWRCFWTEIVAPGPQGIRTQGRLRHQGKEDILLPLILWRSAIKQLPIPANDCSVRFSILVKIVSGRVRAEVHDRMLSDVLQDDVHVLLPEVLWRSACVCLPEPAATNRPALARATGRT